jgi:hypothetical protein
VTQVKFTDIEYLLLADFGQVPHYARGFVPISIQCPGPGRSVSRLISQFPFSNISAHQAPIGTTRKRRLPALARRARLTVHLRHYKNQYCDGLRGPLVIYDPQDPNAGLYDVDDGTPSFSMRDLALMPGRNRKHHHYARRLVSLLVDRSADPAVRPLAFLGWLSH